MGINKVDNIFSWEQMQFINKAISTYETYDDYTLGRIYIQDIKNSFNQEIRDKLYKIVDDITDDPLVIEHALYVEYNGKYGEPNLPPHFDGDTNDLIINIQLSANTIWELGINLETHKLEDNSAMVFNGNKEIHWRPHKKFQEGDYVKMLFVRFYNSSRRSDYSKVPMNQTDEVFQEVIEYRNSLRDL
jgi:PIN domain nuclease of toxin-antitoxin system